MQIQSHPLVSIIKSEGEYVLDKDMNRKAKWVADLMKADGVKAEQVTPELALAYMSAIGRKIAIIQATYLTRSGAREAMLNEVINQ